MSRFNNFNLDSLPSNKKFGWFFSFIFIILSIFFFTKNISFAYFTLTISALFILITTFNCKLLSPLNILWFKLGLFLGRFLSPIILGLLFFVLITPVAIFTRLFGRDILLLKKRSVHSYWIERDKINLSSETFKNQF